MMPRSSLFSLFPLTQRDSSLTEAAVWQVLSVPVYILGSGTLRAPLSRETATPGNWGRAVWSARAAWVCGRGSWAGRGSEGTGR